MRRAKRPAEKYLRGGTRNLQEMTRGKEGGSIPCLYLQLSPFREVHPSIRLSTQLGLSRRLRDSRQHRAACEPCQTYAPLGHEASESWTKPRCQRGTAPSCLVWRGAGRPWGGFHSSETALSWGIWKESLHFSKCSSRGTGAGLWGWPAFMASDSPGELAPSWTLVKLGE